MSFTIKTKTKLVVARVKFIGFRLFLVTLGGVIGASGVFVSYEAPKLIQSETVTFYNAPLVQTVEAKAPEIEKEKTIEEKIADTFPENPSIMIAVAKAESGLNPLATNRNKNGTRDIGLMMINSVHGDDDLDMFDVDKNLKAARKIYDSQGITAWAAFNNNSYKQFLK